MGFIDDENVLGSSPDEYDDDHKQFTGSSDKVNPLTMVDYETQKTLGLAEPHLVSSMNRDLRKG